jgi:hypothetical protein
MAQNSKLEAMVDQSSVEAVREAQKKQKIAEQKIYQLEYQVKEEKKRAGIQIKKIEKRLNNKIQNYRNQELFWKVIFFISVGIIVIKISSGF